MTEGMVMNLVRLLLYLVGMIGFAAFNAAYLTLLERKQASWMQLRRGPTEVGPWGLLQPVADGVKLMSKQLLLPRDVDVPLFLLGPIMVVVPPILCLVTIPFSETLVARNFNLGLLMMVVFSVLALAKVGGLSRWLAMPGGLSALAFADSRPNICRTKCRF